MLIVLINGCNTIVITNLLYPLTVVLTAVCLALIIVLIVSWFNKSGVNNIFVIVCFSTTELIVPFQFTRYHTIMVNFHLCGYFRWNCYFNVIGFICRCLQCVSHTRILEYKSDMISCCLLIAWSFLLMNIISIMKSC